MGASGDLIVCKFGHIVLWIDEHLYWDDELHQQYEKARKMNCPVCGCPTKYSFVHYGDPNDCLNRYAEHPLQFIEKEDRWTIENLTPIELEQALVKT